VVATIVLMHVNTGKAQEVSETVGKIEHVEWAHMVTGPYDVIAYADLPTKSDLRGLVNDIHEVSDIKSTETCIVI